LFSITDFLAVPGLKVFWELVVFLPDQHFGDVAQETTKQLLSALVQDRIQHTGVLKSTYICKHEAFGYVLLSDTDI
jgi:hypothetical protein